MYVGRLPLFAFADLVTAAALLIVTGAVVRLKGVRAVVIPLAIAASPLLVHAIIRTKLERAAAHGMWIHPGLLIYVAPAAFALIVAVAARFLFPRRSQGTGRWRAGFAAVCLAFAYLNLANGCAPGWCERFGFPFAYSWWSDAIVIMNGENLSAGTSVAAVIGNIIVLGVVAMALSFAYRRPVPASARVREIHLHVDRGARSRYPGSHSSDGVEEEPASQRRQEGGGESGEVMAANTEQAVLIFLKLSDDSLGTFDDREAIFDLEEKVEAATTQQNAGEYDGHEFGGGWGTLYLYGPDASRLADLVLPIVRDAAPRQGSYLLRRFGAPGARQERIVL